MVKAGIINNTKGTPPALLCEGPVEEPIASRATFLCLIKGIASFDMTLALFIATAELMLAAFPDSYVALYNMYNMKEEFLDVKIPHETSLFLMVLIFAMFWLLFELWMYEQLYKGALELNTCQLNRWINLRTLFLIINIGLSMYRIYQLQFCLYDMIYIPVTLYRILEIIFVKGLVVQVTDFQMDLRV